MFGGAAAVRDERLGRLALLRLPTASDQAPGEDNDASADESGDQISDPATERDAD